MTTPSTLRALDDDLDGQVLLPVDPGYGEARTVWNAMVDRRPRLTVRAAGVGDVVAFEFVASKGWTDPADDAAVMAAARRGAAAIEPFASGVYVDVLSDEEGETGVGRAYSPEKLARLVALKNRYDPDNVFHLNRNIRPSVVSAEPSVANHKREELPC